MSEEAGKDKVEGWRRLERPGRDAVWVWLEEAVTLFPFASLLEVDPGRGFSVDHPVWGTLHWPVEHRGKRWCVSVTVTRQMMSADGGSVPDGSPFLSGLLVPWVLGYVGWRCLKAGADPETAPKQRPMVTLGELLKSPVSYGSWANDGGRGKGHE